MKLIICILQDNDKEEVSKALNEAGYRVTILPSTGAFFRRGNSTMLIGVADKEIDKVIQIIKDHTTEPDNPNLKRATLFVIKVDDFQQI